LFLRRCWRSPVASSGVAITISLCPTGTGRASHRSEGDLRLRFHELAHGPLERLHWIGAELDDLLHRGVPVGLQGSHVALRRQTEAPVPPGMPQRLDVLGFRLRIERIAEHRSARWNLSSHLAPEFHCRRAYHSLNELGG